MTDSSERRRFLRTAGAGFLAVSGCLRLEDGGTETKTDSTPTIRSETSAATTDANSDTDPDTGTESTTSSGGETESETESEAEPSLSVSGSWPRHQYDSTNTGYHPNTAGPSGGVDLAWRFSTEPTDEREWPNFNPVVANSSVYFSSQDGHVYSVDTTNGTEEWRFSTDSSNFPGDRRKCTPTVAGGTVYAEGTDGFLYALDAESGTQEWALKQSSQAGHTTPIVVDDTVYVSWGTLYALDRTDGSLRWSRRIRATSVAYGDGTLYVSGSDARLSALDPDSGETLWTVDGPTAKPTYADGTIYAASGRAVDDVDPALYAITESGEMRWERALSGEIGGTVAPAVAGDHVLLGTKESRSLYSFSTRDGSEQWSYTTLGWVIAPPTVVDDAVYLGGHSKKLHCVGLDDGSKRWTQVLSSTSHSPTVLDGNVFLGTSDGEVLAFTDRS